jgi:hypothetical protein
MSMGWLLLYAFALYVALGVAIAAAFIVFGVRRVLPHAPAVSLGARVLLFPASVALWPLILTRWSRARSTP